MKIGEIGMKWIFYGSGMTSKIIDLIGLGVSNHREFA
jgi:hypothetical protein